MTRNKLFPTALCALTCGLLAGCMSTMTIEEMKAMMPPRPPELDRLDAFVGKWDYEGEMKFAWLDEAIKTTGTSDTHWDGDRRFVVGRTVMHMGELGDMTGLETWTYDTHGKKYRSTWTDSMGSMGAGVGRFDEKTNTWRMRATSYGPFGKSTAKGQVKFIDDNNAEWTWTEYAMGGLMKTMEMTGTSRRR